MKKERIKHLLIIAASIVLVCGFAATLHAGATYSNYAHCGLDSDGLGGYCSGTRGAFRASSDSSKKMVLQQYFSSSTGYMDRYVYVNSSETGSRNLSVPSSMSEIFDNAILAPDTANIYVRWNSSNAVTTIQIYDSTSYSN